MSRTTIEKKNKYQADISVVAGGTELIANPCVVWEITVIGDQQDAVVSFSNTTGSYASASRLAKARVTAETQTVQLIYPEGKKFSSGVCAVSNIASTDVSITYE